MPRPLTRRVGWAALLAVVIPVDLFGQPADIDTITQFAHSENIRVLVDGAQSFEPAVMVAGLEPWEMRQQLVFFQQTLGCYGDGGAVFTQDDQLADLINSIRLHGKGAEKYDNVRIGMNSRLDTIQAAILIEKLKIFPDELLAREKVASAYDAGLGGKFSTPAVADGLKSAWAQYTLILEDRAAVQAKLKQSGVPSVVYYPKALTQQGGYLNFPTVSSGVNVSDNLSSRVLSLPMHPYVTQNEINKVIEVISETQAVL